MPTIKTNMNRFFQFILKNLIIVLIFKTYEIQGNEDCPKGEKPCASLGGVCIPQSQCPTAMSCPRNYRNLNQYSCALDDNVFPTESQCKLGFECWDNTCINETLINETSEYKNYRLSQCPSMTSCPDESPIRCFDNSCVDNLNDCPKYIECPLFLPVRCPNGDCRRSLDDCPSLIVCPQQYPVLCNDGSCRSLKEECKKSSDETQCSDTSMVRCPDGTCASSKFLCPTSVTCPRGYQKCFNGICKPKGECYNMIRNYNYSSSCSSNENYPNKVICNFDFSCRNEISSCPTGIICPVEKPVKCWDNSCKENIDQCPEYQPCPEGMKECPDGSCAIYRCGTHITCSLDEPFRCFDNTCKKNPKDCPEMPSCPYDKPILCWDGRCLSERGECVTPSECEESSNVRCPNGLCNKLGDNCRAVEGCPAEFDKCPDGTCFKSIKDCNTKECPLNFPYKCDNGMCVSNISHCEKENGCPFNKPFKCKSGKCLKDEEECKDTHNNDEKCSGSKRKCSDGSCLPFSVKCPSASGCPTDFPIKCADGSCISKKDTCPIPVCPSSQPYRCKNGLCVTTISSCPSTVSEVNKSDLGINSNDTDKALVVCADLTLAHFFDECKPLFDCGGTNTYRCGDGSCRENDASCPMLNELSPLDTCPGGYTRCPNGVCSKEEDGCLLENGCYNTSEYKCISNGLCVKNEDECEESNIKFDLANGCKNEYPYKCLNTKKCVTTESECYNLANGCDKDDEIMRINGSCVSAKDLQNLLTNNYTDDEGCAGNNSITCPTVSASICANNFTNCYNKDNCKIEEPFRCINGNCQKYPFSLHSFINTISDNNNKNNKDTNYCEIGIECPQYKPYLCLDGSCVEKTSFCQTLQVCPDSSKYRCFDRTCQETDDQCNKYHQKCPGTNPILCPNGNCVSNIIDCLDTSCPAWQPYKCITGVCTKTPLDCLIQEYTLENNIQNITYDDTCNGTFICYDGTCRENEEDCPLYPGCNLPSNPYKCQDGSCASSPDQCIDSTYNSTSHCNGKKQCEDGICRTNCPDYKGCPNEKPLMCSNGYCVSSLAECAGYSACMSIKYPFRCPDGICVEKIGDCKPLFREYGITNIAIMTYPNKEVNVPIIIGESNLQLATLFIPSDTFNTEKNGSVESRVFISSVPRNKIVNTYSEYNETRYEDIILVYPYVEEEIFSGSFDIPGNPSDSPDKNGGNNSSSNKNNSHNDSNMEPSDSSGKTGGNDSSSNKNNSYSDSHMEDFIFNNTPKINTNNASNNNSSGSSPPKTFISFLANWIYNKTHKNDSSNTFMADWIFNKTLTINASNSIDDSFMADWIFNMTHNINASNTSDYSYMAGWIFNKTHEIGINNSDYSYMAEWIFNKIQLFDVINSSDHSYMADWIFNKIQTIDYTDSDNSYMGDWIFNKNQDIDTSDSSEDSVIDDWIFNRSQKMDTYRHLDKGKLKFEYCVLSTVLNITVENKTNDKDKMPIIWKNNLTLNLLYNFPYKHPGIVEREKEIPVGYSPMPLNRTRDVCLGKLNESNGLWKCNGLRDNKKCFKNCILEASINESGIYAVILAPEVNESLMFIKYNWFVVYIKHIFIIAFAVVLIVGTLIYVFSRIYRYKRKYRSAKEVYHSTNIEFNLLGINLSEIQGETIADQEEGVIWTSNPSFRNVKDDNSDKIKQLEEMRDKFMKNLKALEKNNETLKEQTLNYKKDIQRLNDYKDEIIKGEGF